MNNVFQSQFFTEVLLHFASFNTCRVVLVVNPLYYKRLITKKRFHAAFILTFLMYTVELIFMYIFFRRERLTFLNACTYHVLQDTSLFLNVSVVYVFVASIIVNCIIITMKLRKMKNVAMGSKTGHQENDHKLIQVSWMTLNLFLLFVLPTTLLNIVPYFAPHPLPLVYHILIDISYLLFYMNNVINPFVYYIYLNNFREGFQSMLCCKMNSNCRNTDIRSGSSMNLSHSTQLNNAQR